MIVASHPLATAAGLRALERGGHAVDAVISAAAVLAVVEPAASGLGGDAFFLVTESRSSAHPDPLQPAGSDGETRQRHSNASRSSGSSQVVAINGSGGAPGDLSNTSFAGRNSVPLRSPLSCTTPGCVRAWHDVWQRWGRLPWKEVLAPAAHYAAVGFPVSWRMGRALQRLAPVILADPGLRSVYLDKSGAPLVAGSTCRPRALGRTFAALLDGPEALYGGAIGADLARGVRLAGGALDLIDLAEHRSSFADPHALVLDDVTVIEQPLPSQGLILLVMTGLLATAEQRRPAPARATERALLELRRQIEAKKIAFALKDAFLTDPLHLPVPEAQLAAVLTSSAVLVRLARLFDGEPLVPALCSEVVAHALSEASPEARDLLSAYRAAGFDPAHPPEPGDGATDTTYLCAADVQGNLVGLIQSIFHPFGSGFLEPETGIILNNRACGFSLDPKHINALGPRKRSLHTLNSYMVERSGRPWLVSGTPGGDNQVQTNLQVLRHFLGGQLLWPGPEPQQESYWSQARTERTPVELALPDRLAMALQAPRWRVNRNGRVVLEARFPAELRRKLERTGYDVMRVGPWDGSGFVQAIGVDERPGATAGETTDATLVFVGATDPRGEGQASGR